MAGKRDDKTSPLGGAPTRGEREPGARVEAELSRRGVSPVLARQLADLVRTLGPGAADTMRAAASLASSDRSAAAPSPGAEPPPDVEEIGRLMAGFVGELKKLDEALQLLAAYLTRMRDKSVPSGRILH